MSGALAGICSVCSYFYPCYLPTLIPESGSTYPLDLVRARLSIATASIPVSALPQAKASSSNGAKLSLSSAYHTASASIPRSELSIVGMTLKIMREEGGVRGLFVFFPFYLLTLIFFQKSVGIEGLWLRQRVLHHTWASTLPRTSFCAALSPRPGKPALHANCRVEHWQACRRSFPLYCLQVV